MEMEIERQKSSQRNSEKDQNDIKHSEEEQLKELDDFLTKSVNRIIKKNTNKNQKPFIDLDDKRDSFISYESLGRTATLEDELPMKIALLKQTLHPSFEELCGEFFDYQHRFKSLDDLKKLPKDCHPCLFLKNTKKIIESPQTIYNRIVNNHNISPYSVECHYNININGTLKDFIFIKFKNNEDYLKAEKELQGIKKKIIFYDTTELKESKYYCVVIRGVPKSFGFSSKKTIQCYANKYSQCVNYELEKIVNDEEVAYAYVMKTVEDALGLIYEINHSKSNIYADFHVNSLRPTLEEEKIFLQKIRENKIGRAQKIAQGNNDGTNMVLDMLNKNL